MKKYFKMTFAVVAFVAVGIGSYNAYDSYTAANMSEEDLLLVENVLALSDVSDSKYIEVTAYKGWSEDQNFPDGGRVYETERKCYPISNAWVFDATTCWIKK